MSSEPGGAQLLAGLGVLSAVMHKARGRVERRLGRGGGRDRTGRRTLSAEGFFRSGCQMGCREEKQEWHRPAPTKCCKPCLWPPSRRTSQGRSDYAPRRTVLV